MKIVYPKLLTMEIILLYYSYQITTFDVTKENKMNSSKIMELVKDQAILKLAETHDVSVEEITNALVSGNEKVIGQFKQLIKVVFDKAFN